MIAITGVGTMIALPGGSTVFIAEVMDENGNTAVVPITEDGYEVLVAMSAGEQTGEEETTEPEDVDTEPKPKRLAAGSDEDGVPEF